MNIPSFMLAQRRWMVRPNNDARAKLPQAAFEECPSTYNGDPDKWRYAWANPTIWATIDQAFAYWGKHDDKIAGLCYVLHPADDRGDSLRLICFDFDGCFDDDGNLDPDVARFVDELGSYAERSLSGRGLHVFVMVHCEPFRNVLHFPIGDCKVDILCSAQVAVTGDAFGDYVALNSVSAEILDRFPRKDTTDGGDDLPDFWNEQNAGVRPDQEYLVAHMEKWNPCIEGQGGDKEMFKAACFLARHGATGWDAFNLLTLVEQVPPFDDFELQHKVESAWLSTHAEGEFGVDGLGVFDDFPDDESEEPSAERLVKLRKLFGVMTTEELDEVEEPTFLVENLFVDKESLFIGGREKSFKTGLAADLAISLASGEPFLDSFSVASTRRVAFFTAEIGAPAIKLWVRRICRQKGISSIVKDLVVSAQLPNFQIDKYGYLRDTVGRDHLKELFELDGIEVAVFDPLYFFLLGTSLGDMNAVGGVLRNISKLCEEVNVWPILCHHARKDSTKDFQPMSLGDLSGSGVPAFARQWLLSAHAEPFENGRASLYVRAGGSTPGDRGLWRVGIDEGVEDEIVDRRWNLTVSPEDEHDSYEDARDAILEALRYFGTLETVASIAMYAGVETNVAKEVLRELVREEKADLQNSKFIIR